jgi:hypothetical protein
VYAVEKPQTPRIKGEFAFSDYDLIPPIGLWENSGSRAVSWTVLIDYNPLTLNPAMAGNPEPISLGQGISPNQA